MNFQLNAKPEKGSGLAAQQALSAGIRMNEACFPMNLCPKTLEPLTF